VGENAPKRSPLVKRDRPEEIASAVDYAKRMLIKPSAVFPSVYAMSLLYLAMSSELSPAPSFVSDQVP